MTDEGGSAEKELNSLINDAVEMRHKQDAFTRRYFESLPICIQKTLFDPEEEQSQRSIERFHRFMSEGDTLFKRNRTIEALQEYERAVGQVYYVVLRDNAPHWRERGVRDEWIRVKKYDEDESLAAKALLKIAQCLFMCKQYREAESIATFVLGINNQSPDALVMRARCMFKLPRALEMQDDIARDLASAIKVDPQNAEAKQMLGDLKVLVDAQVVKESKMFKGVLNTPGVRLDPPVKQEEDEVERSELNELELEAAAQAGLDVSDPAIRQLLLKLTTKKGRELFEKEQERLEKVEKRDNARWWMFWMIFSVILFVALLQFWLKSMTQNMPLNTLGDIQRVRQIKEGTYRTRPELSSSLESTVVLKTAETTGNHEDKPSRKEL